MKIPFLPSGLLSLAWMNACTAGSSVVFDASSQAGSHDLISDVDTTIRGRVGFTGAATVAAKALASGEVIGDGVVASDDTFDLDVYADSEAVIVTAFDLEGTALGLVLVDAGPARGQVVVTAPIDAETSLEADVADAVSTSSAGLDAIDTVALRTRIDARVAAASTVDVDEAIQALATAELAAAAATEAALAAAGIEFSAETREAATVDARRALDAVLDAGSDSTEAEAGVAFASLLAFADHGVSAQVAAATEGVSALAFAATVDTLTAGDLDRDEYGGALIDATSSTGGSLSALLSAESVAAALVQAGASETVQARAGAAGDALFEATLGDGSEADAWGAWSAVLVGDGEVTGSILGDALEVDAVSAIVAGLLVEGALGAGDSMRLAVGEDVSSAFADGGALGASASAAGAVVWSDYAEFLTAVDGEVSTVEPFFAGGLGGAAALLVEASGGAGWGGSAE